MTRTGTVGWLLAAEGIGKSFGRRTVLKSASLWASEGRVTGLFGRNGCGKTTLLRIASGCLGADHGVVRFDGTSSERPRLAALARAGLFFLPQEGLLSPAFTVRQHVEAFGVRFAAPVTSVVDALGLHPILGRRGGELSTGERMRASLALAVVRRPRCLLADEPLTGLAPKDRERVAAILRGMAAEGSAVVVTGHEAWELLELADDVIWNVAGTTHHLGPPAEARAHDQFRREYLGPRG